MSEALPAIVVVPLTVAPPAGAEIETVGGEVSGVPAWNVTRTATQSSEKSRLVELATSITRTRKLASLSSARVHVRPQPSAGLPKRWVAMLVVSVALDLVAVQLPPPFHDNCTHIFGEPDVLSARASRRTSIPATLDPEGTFRP